MFRVSYVAINVFLLQTIGAIPFISRLVYGDWDGKSGDKITQGLNLLQIVVGLFLFSQELRRTRSISTGGVLAILAGLFLLASTMWSVDPASTIRRAVLYLCFVISVIGVAGALDGDDFMASLRTICLLSAVASIMLLVISPTSAWMPRSTNLRGIFSHKNALGQVMVAGSLASLHHMRIGVKWRFQMILELSLFISLAFLSKSSTSLVTIVVLSCASWLICLCNRRETRAVGLLLAFLLVPIVVIGALSHDSLFELLGKDPTLTGRTDLWERVIDRIYQSPMLGWGFFAFWSSPFAAKISTTLGWTVPHSHNGLLELLLEIGIVGTAFFIFLFIRNVMLALRCFRTPERELAATLLLCCGWIVLTGITEMVLLDPSEPSLSVFFISGLICERSLRAVRRRQYESTRIGAEAARGISSRASTSSAGLAYGRDVAPPRM
jgi:exopolysaccharide production protein ExoQ